MTGHCGRSNDLSNADGSYVVKISPIPTGIGLIRYETLFERRLLFIRIENVVDFFSDLILGVF